MTRRFYTVLVADADADTRVILKTALEQCGFGVVDARAADEALALAQEHDVQLVILNYPMPSPDGRTLTQRLRAEPKTSNTPIINFSSHVLPDTLEHAAAHGVTVNLAKPSGIDEIIRAVLQLIPPRP